MPPQKNLWVPEGSFEEASFLTDGYVSYKTHFKDEKGIDLAFCWSQ